MSDNAADQQQGADQGGSRGSAAPGGQSNGGGGFTQEQVNAMIAAERREVEAKFQGFDDYKSKAEQFDQLTAEQKSEIQQATEAANDFRSKWEAEQKARAKLETQLQRQQIAATKHLDPDLWDRVRGNTPEEIEADVQKLVEKFGTSSPRAAAPLRSGASMPDGKTDKQRAADALRSLGAGR
uniref:Scaffolding protein n=1 Tax=Mycobacterium phage Farewell TaxID=3158893 RepID=A0AAU8GMK0_9CAUD